MTIQNFNITVIRVRRKKITFKDVSGKTFASYNIKIISIFHLLLW